MIFFSKYDISISCTFLIETLSMTDLIGYDLKNFVGFLIITYKFSKIRHSVFKKFIREMVSIKIICSNVCLLIFQINSSQTSPSFIKLTKNKKNKN